jgi:hypothetical protein
MRDRIGSIRIHRRVVPYPFPGRTHQLNKNPGSHSMLPCRLNIYTKGRNIQTYGIIRTNRLRLLPRRTKDTVLPFGIKGRKKKREKKKVPHTSLLLMEMNYTLRDPPPNEPQQPSNRPQDIHSGFVSFPQDPLYGILKPLDRKCSLSE